MVCFELKRSSLMNLGASHANLRSFRVQISHVKLNQELDLLNRCIKITIVFLVVIMYKILITICTFKGGEEFA